MGWGRNSNFVFIVGCDEHWCRIYRIHPIAYFLCFDWVMVILWETQRNFSSSIILCNSRNHRYDKVVRGIESNVPITLGKFRGRSPSFDEGGSSIFFKDTLLHL